jgi:hypothetical protein
MCSGIGISLPDWGDPESLPSRVLRIQLNQGWHGANVCDPDDANAFNRLHQKTRHVFQGRYTEIPVQLETHLRELSRFVVLKPVRAGIVRDAGDWRWGSDRQTAAFDQPALWLAKDTILGWFGHRLCVAVGQCIEFVAAGVRV